MMMRALDHFSLEDRRALVTGGSRGLGAAMARGLAEAGAQVALVARSGEQLAYAASIIGDRAVPIVADVSDASSFPMLVDRLEAALGGPLDIVLHAAGTQHRQPAFDFEHEAWERIITVNLTAPFLLSQEIGRRQVAAGAPGSHIFIGSLGSHQGLRNVVAYAASKAGVAGVVRTLAVEWAPHGIRVNGIGPGYISTELTKALFDDPVRREELFRRIPMGRFGSPEDMMGAAVFLASDASAYVTGQLLMVDGGWMAS